MIFSTITIQPLKTIKNLCRPLDETNADRNNGSCFSFKYSFYTTLAHSKAHKHIWMAPLHPNITWLILCNVPFSPFFSKNYCICDKNSTIIQDFWFSDRFSFGFVHVNNRIFFSKQTVKSFDHRLPKKLVLMDTRNHLHQINHFLTYAIQIVQIHQSHLIFQMQQTKMS